MPFNGSGTFTLSQPAFVPGTTISSAAVNSDLSDIATNGLSKCVTVDGQNPITGQLKFPDGTAGAPPISFTSDLTTGMYRIGAKHLGFSAGGSEIFALNGNNFGTGQSGNVLEIASPSGVVSPFPVGMVVDFAGTSAPSGWFLCFGQTVLIASYPEFFNVVGTTYGGDGITTCGVPDYRGRVGAGKDNMGGSAANRIGTVSTDSGTIVGTTLGSVGGSSTHVQTTGELVTHSHANSLSDLGHFHGLTGTTGASTNQAQGGNTTSPLYAAGGSTNTNTATTGITLTNVNAGSSNAMAWLQPTLIMNKIIFAGRV